MTAQQATTGTVRVLYVDDYEKDRELVRDALSQDGGYQLAEAASRQEFESQLTDGCFDVVLSDFNILGFEGLQVVDRVRDRCPDMPVVIVTGTGSEEVAVQAWKRGAADYVIKTPQHIRRLPHTIRSVIAKKQSEQELQASEARNRRILEASIGGIYIYDIELGRNNYINPQYAALTGYTLEQINGMKANEFFALFHPDDQPRIAAHMQYVSEDLPDGKNSQIDYRFKLASGDWAWYTSCDAVFERDSHGKARQLIGTFIDITDRKQAEQELRLRDEAIATSVMPLAFGDGNFSITYANQAFLDLLGFDSMEQALGPNNRFESHPMSIEEINAAMLEHGMVTAEVVSRKLDGTPIDLLISATLIRDEAGQPLSSLVSMMNITHRKQSETSIRGLQSIASDLSATFDEKVDQLLRLGCQRFGMEMAILGRAAELHYIVTNVVAPEGFPIAAGDQFELSETYDALTLEADAPVGIEHVGGTAMVDHPQYQKTGLEAYLGTPIYVGGRAVATISFTSQQARSVPFSDAEKDFAQLMARWISYEWERIESETALRESEARYRSLFEQAPDLIYFVDPASGRILDCNANAAESLGYTHDELCQLSIADIDAAFSPEGVAKKFEKVLRDGSDHFESRIRTKSGKIRDLAVSARSVSVAGQIYFQAIAKDVTERNDLEQQLRRADRLASLGTLAAGIAHEINNPLAAAWAAAEAAKAFKDKPDSADLLDESLNAIGSAVQRCQLIIENVLRFARKESSEKKLHDLNDIVQQAVQTTQQYATDNGSTITVDLADGLPQVTLNSTEIEQVLVNLIRNSVEAGDKTCVSIHTEQADQVVRVVVSDDGKGIDYAQVERVFDPFFSNKEKTEGMGLGLAISHRIAGDHNGTIDIESEFGVGTTATLTLAVPVLR